MLRDVWSAVRALSRQRLADVIVLASLALAIGGNTTVFSLASAVAFHEWSYEEPDRLVVAFETPLSRPGSVGLVSPANFVDWRERSTAFAAMAAVRMLRSSSLKVVDTTEPVAVTAVTPNLFDTLGVQPWGGRLFDPHADPAGVVILAHHFWQRRFAGDPAVLGRTVTIDGVAHRVSGILPSEFELTVGAFDLVLPLDLSTSATLSRDRRTLEVWARLKAGVPPVAAQADLAAVSADLATEHPEANEGYRARVLTLEEFEALNPAGLVLYLLQAALGFVLLIACGNVANVLLARAHDRRHEFAVRAALGASRVAMMRLVLAESVTLAGLGGLLGCALSVVAIRGLGAALAGLLPRSMSPEINLTVLGFTAALSLVTGVVCGLLAALQAGDSALSTELRQGGRGSVIGPRHWWTRALVVGEVALALMLLSGASLMIDGIQRWQRLDAGFRVDDLLVLRVAGDGGDGASRHEGVTLADRVRQRLETVPGVLTAATASTLPLTSFPPQTPFVVEELDPTAGDSLQATLVTVSPAYLQTMGIPLRRGRAFAVHDTADTGPVAMVSEETARLYFSGVDPIGARVGVRGRSRRVVGVVGNVRQDLFRHPQAPEPVIYLPQTQEPRSSWVVLRVGHDARALVGPIREAVAAVDRDAAVSVQTLQAVIDRRSRTIRLTSLVLAGLGGLATLLAAVGLYGVMSVSVTRRTRDLGLRLALGARPAQLVASVARDGLVLIGLGLVVGWPGGYLVSRTLLSVLADAAPASASTPLRLGLLLVVIGAVASVIPACRAARLDPAEPLRG